MPDQAQDDPCGELAAVESERYSAESRYASMKFMYDMQLRGNPLELRRRRPKTAEWEVN